MAIRCMGQFIGREKAYSSINIFQNFKEIYERQGIGGFFVYVNKTFAEFFLIFIFEIIVDLSLDGYLKFRLLLSQMSSYICLKHNYHLKLK
jgi:hypothetical protein